MAEYDDQEPVLLRMMRTSLEMAETERREAQNALKTAHLWAKLQGISTLSFASACGLKPSRLTEITGYE